MGFGDTLLAKTWGKIHRNANSNELELFMALHGTIINRGESCEQWINRLQRFSLNASTSLRSHWRNRPRRGQRFVCVLVTHRDCDQHNTLAARRAAPRGYQNCLNCTPIAMYRCNPSKFGGVEKACKRDLRHRAKNIAIELWDELFQDESADDREFIDSFVGDERSTFDTGPFWYDEQYLRESAIKYFRLARDVGAVEDVAETSTAATERAQANARRSRTASSSASSASSSSSS